MGRPVALLDVDHTLLFDDRLNATLLDSLKSNGVSDVFLFTDMTLTSSSTKDRMTLVENLQGRGFTVHGVVTPLDVVWDKIPVDQAAGFWTYATQFGPRKLNGDDLRAFLDDKKLPKDYLFARESLNMNLANVTCGIAYRDAVEVLPLVEGQGGAMPSSMNERSNIAKLLADQIAQQAGYTHTKGLLLDAFMTSKPDWVSSVLVIDDHAHVMKAIQEYQDKSNPNVVITTIHVTDESLDPSFYNTAIQQHVLKDPYLKVQALQTLCEDYKKHLEQTLIQYIQDLPEEALTIFTNKGGSINTAAMINPSNAKHLAQCDVTLPLLVEKYRIVNSMMDKLIDPTVHSNEQKLHNFKSEMTDETKRVLSSRRDMNRGFQFLENIFHTLTLGIYSKLTKGTFQFWKSHGEALTDKLEDIDRGKTPNT